MKLTDLNKILKLLNINEYSIRVYGINYLRFVVKKRGGKVQEMYEIILNDCNITGIITTIIIIDFDLPFSLRRDPIVTKHKIALQI